MAAPVSDLFDPDVWTPAPIAEQFTDITYHKHVSKGIVRVAFDRPEVRNAFRPRTVDELYRALDDARQDPRVGVVLLTGNGPSPKDGGWAFCSGGDQRIRGGAATSTSAPRVHRRRASTPRQHRRPWGGCTSSRSSA